MEKISKNSEYSCSVFFKDNASPFATHPTVILRFVEIPVTALKAPLYQINDLYLLIHSVVHTCRPDLAKCSLVKDEINKQFIWNESYSFSYRSYYQ